MKPRRPPSYTELKASLPGQSPLPGWVELLVVLAAVSSLLAAPLLIL
jgi:hypothetical protein